MIETWTQDDLDLFEEVTGLKAIWRNGRIPMLQPREIMPGGLFQYEWMNSDNWSWEIIESVILLSHSIPRKDLLEMLR